MAPFNDDEANPNVKRESAHQTDQNRPEPNKESELPPTHEPYGSCATRGAHGPHRKPHTCHASRMHRKAPRQGAEPKQADK